MKKIMILGASILQLPAIKKAKQLGLYVIAVDMNPLAIGLRYADEFKIISVNEIDDVLVYAQSSNIDGIMTLASDMPMMTVATVSQKMKLNSVTVETAKHTTNKAAMRKRLDVKNIAIPKFDVVKNRVEFESALKKYTTKVIVKPSDNSGSRGIFLIHDTSNYEEVEDAYQHSITNSKNGVLLIEEFMEGTEVSVETISINGKCHVIQITDKLTTGAPHFVELGHAQPSKLSFDILQKIIELTQEAVEALGINIGPSHTEIIVTNDGPKIVEVGARLGGDNITTHLVPLSTGIDMVELCIRIAVGEEVTLNSSKHNSAVIKYFVTPQGTLEDFQGIEESLSIPGVKEVIINKSKGDQVGIIKSSVDRIGYVIATSDTVEDATLLCEKVMETVTFNIRVT
ncbi:MAG: ATP-grasp domain-containing protein [Candidatus Pristimantibacillus lignocellulolyticus]|uniref:ATP-grasp domain-containing protein n=1 Tax=Candidatus Pristimantibacillus lignocellulolyticus TaxID=2994561 RepID=A0A9J6ZD92_9BACL|nr:MAG: ATP-grasp domain-containing protein [Candidatus Pristimantibacillus lignocellulolyticus]